MQHHQILNGASVIFSPFIGVELTCWKARTQPQVTAGFDPGRVKTPKGRSREGNMFYRRRGFRVVLPLLARTLGLEKKAVLGVLHAPAF